MKKSQDKPITSVKIGEQLKYLCQGNNQQNKVYAIDKRDFADLILDMYESKYSVFEYPADCDDNNKSYERGKKQKTIAKHIDNISGVSFDWINVYCKFFGCSSDYLLGIISEPTHEITDINKKTGLTTAAASKLLQADKDTQLLYDRLVAGGYLDNLVSVINTFYDIGASVQITGEKITDKETINNLQAAIESIKLKMLRDKGADCIHNLAYDDQVKKHFLVSRINLYKTKSNNLLGTYFDSSVLDNWIKEVEKEQ